MKAWISSIAVVVLFTVSAIAITAQSEAGGGGRAEQRSTGVVDTTFKSRPRPTVKRTAPKRTAPKKTAAEYEADGDNYYDQKDYDSALVAYENAVRLKPSYKSLYRVGWIYNDFSEYAKALAAQRQAVASVRTAHEIFKTRQVMDRFGSWQVTEKVDSLKRGPAGTHGSRPLKIIMARHQNVCTEM